MIAVSKVGGILKTSCSCEGGDGRRFKKYLGGELTPKEGKKWQKEFKRVEKIRCEVCGDSLEVQIWLELIRKVNKRITT